MLSPAVEDYLKVIYKLQSNGDEPAVSTGEVARAMEVSAPSATSMVKRLDDLGFLTYESYRGAVLTESGQKVALEVIRHHRLLELYLREVMGYTWSEVHDEAEHLEHHISETFEDKIEEMLGYPTRDPYGHPIPARDGSLDAVSTRSLAQMEVGDTARIDYIADEDADLLHLLEERGLLPSAHVEVTETRPLDGLLTVAVDGAKQIVGEPVAAKVFVTSAGGGSKTASDAA